MKKCSTLFLAITLPNLIRFSKCLHCKETDEICNKTYIKFSPYLQYIHCNTTCEIQTFDNDTNCAEIQYRISHKSNHGHKICSKYSSLICIRAHSWVSHSLIAKRDFYLSAEQRPQSDSQQRCLVSEPGNITVHISRSDYIICGIAQQHVCQPVPCFQNVNELKQSLLYVWYGMEPRIVDSAINEWRMSLHSTSLFAAKWGSFERYKCCNNIKNRFNQQH